MCGIVGMLLHGGNVERWVAEMSASTDLMVRRGPDRKGLWSSASGCVLGFRRLSILDLGTTGDQPMLTHDGRYALVFNGELYNYRELRSELQANGTTFRSTGDAEVVLHAIAQRGVAALDAFNGMFALAFYDVSERRLLLARDHAGIKPLYVLRHREGVLFASQFDQILRHPWAHERSIEKRGLELYLNFGYLPAPTAMLEGSAAVEAGCWIEFSSNGAERGGRWFSFPVNPEPKVRNSVALDLVDAAVTGAVRRQLVSDVPVGLLLSGGIDSPLVAAKAQEIVGRDRPLPAFTLGINGMPGDESADAATYARALSLRHVIRHITSDDVLDLLDDVVAACSEPLDDYSIFPTTLISKVAREEVAVALSGDGGDDLFWGYPSRMIEPLLPAARRPGGWRRGIGRLLGRGATRGHTGAHQLRIHRFVSRRLLAEVFPNLRLDFPELALFSYDQSGEDTLANWLRWNECSGHLVKVLQKVDRASMHWSLEVRVPLLDREVIDAAASVNWRDCVDLGERVGKLPLRAALGRHVPFQTIAKRGFEAPMDSWLRGPLRPMVEDLVLARSDLLGMPIDRRALRRIVETHQTGEQNSTTLLWRLLSLALWEAHHLSRPIVTRTGASPAIPIS